MKRIITAIFVFAAGVLAGGQTITPTGGINVGSSVVIGGPANCVLFNSGSVVGCKANVVEDDGTGGSSPNSITIPAAVSTAPTGFFLDSGHTTGVTKSAAGSLVLGGNLQSSADFAFTNTKVAQIVTGGVLAWSSATNVPGTLVTGISQGVTGAVLAIGNGTAGNATGGIQTGNATLTSLTTGTNADFLCLSAGGAILIQTTACTISSLRFKPDWKPYQDDAAAKIAKLDVGTFHLQTGPNADPNAESLQAGLSAESVAAIAPECAIYENDMKTPKSYRQECVIALLVKAIQQLKK